MQNSSGDKQRLLHILKAIDDIEAFVGGIPASVFFENSLIKSGCVFQLQVIGEAANHLSKELTGKYNDIEWSQIVWHKKYYCTFLLGN